MPKNVIRESIRHHLLRAFERAVQAGLADSDAVRRLVHSFDVTREGRGFVARWTEPSESALVIDPGAFQLYSRDERNADETARRNADAADAFAAQVIARLPANRDGRLRREEAFHDDWADSVRIEDVMVREAFTAVTAPEHRWILERLGDLAGKQVLDLGCGLGEAAVFFALHGAQVTACDLSPRMLQLVEQVAAFHATQVRTHAAPAEATGLPSGSFDVVYAGNLLHHVDTERALGEIHRLLVPGGVAVTWDPLAHNPVINVYRRMAAAVRTPDEHPLRIADLRLFRERFSRVEWNTYWLFTLAIFLQFYLIERVHPAKERYWKKILKEAPRIAQRYRWLEHIDRVVLRAAPWLRRYCWNVVVFAQKQERNAT